MIADITAVMADSGHTERHIKQKVKGQLSPPLKKYGEFPSREIIQSKQQGREQERTR